MKRTFLILALLAFGAMAIAFPASSHAQSASPSPPPAPSGENFEAVKQFLLTSAATDFHEHQPPFPVQFRKVRIGHVGENRKDASYRLCGEFITKGNEAEWIGFVTIKTSGYEQFLGSSTTYCTDPKMIWDTTEDLSAELKKRLDSVAKKE